MAYDEDGVVDFAQVTTGFNTGLPRIEDQRRFGQWYDGDYANLIPKTGTLANGLTLFSRTDLVDVPIFRLISSYYQDGILSSRPTIVASNNSLKAWLADRKDMIDRVLEKAILNWSVMGRVVFLTDTAGNWRAVRPYNHIAVKSPDDEEKVIGHILIYPFRQPTGGVQHPTLVKNVPDRINVLKYSEELGINEFAQYQVAGTVIGNLVQGPITGSVTGVWDGGGDDSIYRPIAKLCSTLMVRLTLANRGMNRNSDPHMTVPAGALAAAPPQLPGNPVSDTKPKNLQEAIANGRGAILGVSPDENGTYGYMTFDAAPAGVQAAIEYLVSLIHVSSGVPAQSFGFNVGLNESGAARKTAMLRSEQLIREIRNELERLFPLMIQALGAPAGNIHISWGRDPLESEEERDDRVLKLLAGGIITQNEARELLNMEPLPEEEMPEQPVQAAPEDRETPNAEDNGS